MEVYNDNLWVCPDCTLMICNGDGADDPNGWERAFIGQWPDPELRMGFVPNFDGGDGYEEFSCLSCDGCGSSLAGGRWRMSILVTPERMSRESAYDEHMES